MEDMKKVYKNHIHEMVDAIGNEEYLQKIYTFALVKYKKDLKGEFSNEQYK